MLLRLDWELVLSIGHPSFTFGRLAVSAQAVLCGRQGALGVLELGALRSASVHGACLQLSMPVLPVAMILALSASWLVC